MLFCEQIKSIYLVISVTGLTVSRVQYLPVYATAQQPIVIYKEIDSSKQQHHGYRVIKKPKNKDGVDTVRGTAYKEKHIGRNLEM